MAEKREFLHIAAIYTSSQYILPPVYNRFLERKLSASLWVETLRSENIVDAIARGHLRHIEGVQIFSQRLQ